VNFDIYSRGITGDVFAIRGCGRQVTNMLFLRVQELQTETALMRVSQVPRDVKRRAGFYCRFNVA
jgi:hypothetical protein